MRSVRIWFTKTDTAKYISHLDLTRCMIRAFRRTDIPLWYTEGFNPHPHLVFGLSLPLGAEGVCETMDIRLNDDSYTNERVLENLNAVSVPGIKFLKAHEPQYKTLDIAAAQYSVLIPLDGEAYESAVSMIKEKIVGGSLTYEKKTKKGDIKIIDICEHIRKLSFSNEGEFLKLGFILPAGNDFTVNPLMFCKSLFPDNTDKSSMCRVTREKLLLKDDTEYR